MYNHDTRTYILRAVVGEQTKQINQRHTKNTIKPLHALLTIIMLVIVSKENKPGTAVHTRVYVVTFYTKITQVRAYLL